MGSILSTYSEPCQRHNVQGDPADSQHHLMQNIQASAIWTAYHDIFNSTDESCSLSESAPEGEIVEVTSRFQGLAYFLWLNAVLLAFQSAVMPSTRVYVGPRFIRLTLWWFSTHDLFLNSRHFVLNSRPVLIWIELPSTQHHSTRPIS